jgi:hypothetical protein
MLDRRRGTGTRRNTLPAPPVTVPTDSSSFGILPCSCGEGTHAEGESLQPAAQATSLGFSLCFRLHCASNPKSETRNPKQIRMDEIPILQTLADRVRRFRAFRHWCLALVSDFEIRISDFTLPQSPLRLRGGWRRPGRTCTRPGVAAVGSARRSSRGGGSGTQTACWTRS